MSEFSTEGLTARFLTLSGVVSASVIGVEGSGTLRGPVGETPTLRNILARVFGVRVISFLGDVLGFP